MATARRLNRTVSLGSSVGIETTWLVYGATDYADALTEFEAEVPGTLDGLILRDYGLGDAFGGGAWPGFARYAPAGFIDANKPKASEPLEVGESFITYTTIGGSQRILSSLETIAAEAGDGYASVPDHGGAINVAGDAVEGVDITVPVVKVVYRTVLADSFVDSTYLALVRNLTGCVNNAPFLDGAAGEVKFNGANLSQRKGDDWDADFEFEFSSNQTGITLDGRLDGPIDKQGWDYLWILFEDEEDATAKQMVKRIRAAYVERVYPRADLNALLP